MLDHPRRAAEFSVDDAWTFEEVAKKIGGYFEGKQPIKDSFIVPAMG